MVAVHSHNTRANNTSNTTMTSRFSPFTPVFHLFGPSMYVGRIHVLLWVIDRNSDVSIAMSRDKIICCTHVPCVRQVVARSKRTSSLMREKANVTHVYVPTTSPGSGKTHLQSVLLARTVNTSIFNCERLSTWFQCNPVLYCCSGRLVLVRGSHRPF